MSLENADNEEVDTFQAFIRWVDIVLHGHSPVKCCNRPEQLNLQLPGWTVSDPPKRVQDVAPKCTESWRLEILHDKLFPV